MKNTHSTQFMALRAAYLLTQYHLPQREIKDELKVSQSRVSRLLSIAEEKGWLSRTVVLEEGKINKSLLEEVRISCSYTDRSLLGALHSAAEGDGVKVTDVRVFPTDKPSTVRSSGFARAAAHRVRELLYSAESVGVTWGETIKQVIDSLASQGTSRSNDLLKRVRVVPLSGELPDRPIQHSSSHLANRLDHIINVEKESSTPSLAGIVAFIPFSLSLSAQKTLEESIRRSASYQQIFGNTSDEGLVAQLDCVLTSVGLNKNPFGGRMSEFLQATDASEVELRKLVTSDFAGTLLAKAMLGKEDKKKIQRLNTRWTGINLDHLSKIALRAYGGKKAGNVVIATGAEKASVLLAAVRLGLVNQVVIDDALAKELLKLCERQIHTDRRN